jgi:hypothetical protein
MIVMAMETRAMMVGHISNALGPDRTVLRRLKLTQPAKWEI